MDHVERLFWSLAIFIGVHFIWLGLLEPFLPVIVGTVIAVVGGLYFFFRGYRRFSDGKGSV